MSVHIQAEQINQHVSLSFRGRKYLRVERLLGSFLFSRLCYLCSELLLENLAFGEAGAFGGHCRQNCSMQLLILHLSSVCLLFGDDIFSHQAIQYLQ
jgi:hypothetical protein